MNVPARKRDASTAVLAALDDLLAIPEANRRHELIEGSIFEKEAASGEHGIAQRAIAAYVGPFVRRAGDRFPGGWWIVTGTEVFFDAKNTFAPDLSGWRRERHPEHPTGSPIRVRQDWICEIISTNRGHDLVKKKRVYHRHEVPHYWIVDPVREMLTVYGWRPEGYMELQFAERGEIIQPEPFEVVPLHVGFLFGDDPEDDEVVGE
jgi:Uma2 family endonuclease